MKAMWFYGMKLLIVCNHPTRFDIDIGIGNGIDIVVEEIKRF